MPGRPSDAPTLLLDLGGTKVAASMAAEQGLAGRVRFEGVGAARTPGDVLDMMMGAAVAAGLDRAAPRCRKVVVAVPGTLSADGSTLVSAANLPFARFPLREALAELFATRDVILEGDVNCGAIGEAAFGAARGDDDVAYVSISTGIGSGVLAGGTLVRGAHRGAGEIGHLRYRKGGRFCGCGRRGCVEAYCSGLGVVGSWREVAPTAHDDPARAAEATSRASARDVIEAAYRGDRRAMTAVQEALECLESVADVIRAAYDPSVIVLGGGLMNNGEFERDAIAAAARGCGAGARVVRAALGDDAVLFGALKLSEHEEAVQ